MGLRQLWILNQETGGSKCNICNRLHTGWKKSSNQKHRHPPVSVSDYAIKIDDMTSKTWYCLICARKFTSKKEIVDHFNTHTRQETRLLGTVTLPRFINYFAEEHTETELEQETVLKPCITSKELIELMYKDVSAETFLGVKCMVNELGKTQVKEFQMKLCYLEAEGEDVLVLGTDQQFWVICTYDVDIQEKFKTVIRMQKLPNLKVLDTYVNIDLNTRQLMINLQLMSWESTKLKKDLMFGCNFNQFSDYKLDKRHLALGMKSLEQTLPKIKAFKKRELTKD